MIEKVYVANYDVSRRPHFKAEYAKTDIPYTLTDDDFFAVGFDSLTRENLKEYDKKFHFDHDKIITKILKKNPGFYNSALRYVANWLSHLTFLHDAIEHKYKSFMIFEDNIINTNPLLKDDIEHFQKLNNENKLFKLHLQNRDRKYGNFNFINMHDDSSMRPIWGGQAIVYHVPRPIEFKNTVLDMAYNSSGVGFEITLANRKDLQTILHKNYFNHAPAAEFKSMVSCRYICSAKSDFDHPLDEDILKYLKTFEVKYKKLF